MSTDGGGGGGDGGMRAMQRMLREAQDKFRKTATKLRDVRKQQGESQARIDAALKERDEARQRADQSGPEVERLRGELRDRAHYQAFDRLAAERGVAEDARAILYREIGYRAEGDAPDEPKIIAAIDAAKTRPGLHRFFESEGARGTSPPSAPAAGSGQGGRLDAAAGRMRVTTDQMRDGRWAMDHSAEIRRHRAAGTLDIISD